MGNSSKWVSVKIFHSGWRSTLSHAASLAEMYIHTKHYHSLSLFGYTIQLYYILIYTFLHCVYRIRYHVKCLKVHMYVHIPLTWYFAMSLLFQCVCGTSWIDSLRLCVLSLKFRVFGSSRSFPPIWVSIWRTSCRKPHKKTIVPVKISSSSFLLL